MKTIVALLLLVTTASAKDIPWELATSRTVPGKNQPAKCDEFARALGKIMAANGIKHHILVYVVDPIITGTYPDFPAHHGYEGHSVCVYWDEKGVWAMDNQLMQPIRISDGDASHMARRIAGPERSTTLAYFADASEPPVKGWKPGPNYARAK